MLGFTPPQWALSLWFTCKGATAAGAGGTGAPKRPELPTGAWTQGGLVAASKGTKIWKGPKGPKRTRTSFDPSLFLFSCSWFWGRWVGTCFNHFHVWESASPELVGSSKAWLIDIKMLMLRVKQTCHTRREGPWRIAVQHFQKSGIIPLQPHTQWICKVELIKIKKPPTNYQTMRHTAVSPNWGPPTDDPWFWFGGSLRLGKFRTPPVTSEPIAVLFHNVIVIVKDVFCKASRSTKEARATWIKGVYIWMSIVVLICFNYIMGLIMEHGKLTRTNIAACNDGGILMERKRHWMTTDDSLMTPHEIVIQCVNPWSKNYLSKKGMTARYP